MKWLRRDQRGMTLIELMVVISILGVLVSIVVPSVTGVTTAGRDKSFAEDKNNIGKAVTAYYLDASTFNTDATRRKWPSYSSVITTTPVITTGAPYYIDFYNLTSNGFLSAAPVSAGPANNISPVSRTVPISITWGVVTPTIAGTGHYNWYIGTDGVVHAWGTSNAGVDIYDGTYP